MLIMIKPEGMGKVQRKPYLLSTFDFSLSSHALIKDNCFSFSKFARATSVDIK